MSPVQQRPILHGRDHCPGGADPIPCILTGPSGTVDEAILATVPGAYYKLDETGSDDWADSSPGNRDATYVSRTGEVRGVASGLDEGDGSLCVTVDGGVPGAAHAAAYIGAATSSWFEMAGTQEMSVTARVRPDEFLGTVPYTQGICGNMTSTGGGHPHGWSLCILPAGYFAGSDGYVAFRRHSAATVDEVYSTTDLVLDEWTRVTVTYDGTDVRFYFDTTAVGTDTSSASLPSGSAYQTLYLAGQGANEGIGGTWSTYNGELDSVAVWDRALTPSEVGGIAAFETSPGGAAAGWVMTTDGAGGTTWSAPTMEIEF